MSDPGADPRDGRTPAPQHDPFTARSWRERAGHRAGEGPGASGSDDVSVSVVGSLLAGPAVWGGVGYLLDRWLGTGPAFTVVGILAGAMTSLYIVYLRFGRDD